MANPNNAVGTNGAFGGRTSVNAFNDVLATFTGRGVIQGWAVTPSTGLKVNVGGQSGIRDVAIAEDNNGNRTTIDNISQAPIEITMPSAPSTGSRIDLIVGYVENPPQGSSTLIDNPAPTGIITVSGSSSSSPSAPTDSAIRTALTNAGINGATAYYVILGSITIPSGTTDISANMINATPYTTLNTQNNIATGQITVDKIDLTTLYLQPSTTLQNFSGLTAGKWFVTLFVQGQTSGGRGYIGAQIYQNGTFAKINYQTSDQANDWLSASCSYIATISAGETLGVKAETSSAILHNESRRSGAYAIKIG